MKRAIPIVLVLAVAALGVWFWLHRPAKADGIDISGTVEATQVDCSFQIAGTLIKLDLDEGDRVDKGQLIAQLDPAELQDQEKAAAAAVAAVTAQIAQVRAQLSMTGEVSSAQVKQAEAALEESRQRHQALQSGSRTQEIRAARDVAAQAAAELANLKREDQRASNLFDQGVMPAQKRDAAHTSYLVGLNRYRQAKEQLSLLEEGARSEDIAAAAARVSQASAALESAQASTGQTQVLRRQLVTLAVGRDQATSQLAAVRTRLGYCDLRSPIAGTVLVKPREKGEVVAPGTVVVSLADLSNLYLEAFINETDRGRVKLDQEVEVSTDSYPGKIYQGKIYYISSQAEFTPRNLQTKEDRVKLVYRIKVRLPESGGELSPGMIADGRIRTDSRAR